MTDPGDVTNEEPDRPESRSISTMLLHRLKAADDAAWRRLSRLYVPEVHRWCVAQRLQAEDADDVVQEVFRTVHGRIGDFRRDRPGDTFRGWLWTITQYKIRAFYSRRVRREAARGGTDAYQWLASVPEEKPASDSFDLSTRSSTLCHRALELIQTEFEQTTWKAFWMVVVDGQSPAEVAKDLECTRNAVYIAKARVLRRLRDTLGDDGFREFE